MAGVVAAYYLSSGASSSSTTTSSSSQNTTSSSSQSTTTTTTSTQSTTSTQTTSVPNTVSIDAEAYPIGGLSQITGWYNPYPNYQEYDVYQTLTTVNESALWHHGTWQFLPGLASNWTSSQDSTVWTFHLRHGVTFSNGDPFNSYQVWMQFYATYYLEGNASGWLNNYNIFDYTGVVFGPATISMINQTGGLVNPSQSAIAVMSNSNWPIYAPDAYTLVFHLKGPFPWVAGTGLSYAGLLYDSQYVLEHGGFGTPASPNNAPFETVPIPGTGPYKVVSAVTNSYTTFTQNPTYWGRNLTAAQIAQQPLLGPGYVKNVDVYYKPDDVSRYTDLSTGAVQISEIQQSDWNLVTSNSQFSYLTLPAWSGEVDPLGLNVNVYPTNITAFRQAIVHAINYTELNQKAFLGANSQFVGPEFPSWSQFYDLGGLTPYQFNLTLAQQYLTESGVNVATMQPLVLKIVAECELCSNGAQVIQSDLSQIGIQVTIETETSGNYFSVFGGYSTNVADAQQIGQLAWVDGGFGFGPYGAPSDYWSAFVSNNSVWGNWAGYSNPIVQKCVNDFGTTADMTQIVTDCTAAQRQIYNDAPYDWLGTFGLWLVYGGSTVWNNHVIKNTMMFDPSWDAQNSVPFFQTIQYVGS